MMLNGVHYPEPTDQQIQQIHTEHKLANDAFWQKRKTKTVTTRKPHTCEKCSRIILIGARAKVRSVVVGTGWPFSLTTKYSHIGDCPP